MTGRMIVAIIAAAALIAITGCKKSSNDSTTVNETVKADTVFSLIQSNAFPNYNGWNSIAMDTTSNKIFFYYADNTEGFKIDMYDVNTGNTTNIYKHFTQSGQSQWTASNGSEGMRMRFFPVTADGYKIIVPGGATNQFFVEIKVNNDYSTAFTSVINMPNSSNSIPVYDAYDTDLGQNGASNVISVVSMYNSVYNGVYPTYTVSNTSHGSSIVGTPGGLEYVFCGDAKTLELYNNGAFLKGISFTAGESQLQMDSKGRIYLYNGSSIFRFSSDLSKKEEFPIKGSLAGYRDCALVIRHNSKYVQLYSFSGKDLIGMKIPW